MFIESYHRRLFYEYEGNQLSYLTERATASMATNDVYVPGPTARMGYSYDWNGNMTNDYRKGLKFQYNFVNLVRRVQDDGGSTLAEYTYSVDGRKRQAVGGDGKGFRYRGDLVYTVNGGSLSLESAAFGEGRIAKTSGSYSPLYFVTDHLGSVRVVEDQSGTVCESNDYYPSGSRWKDPTSKVSTNRYRFSGKEEQTLGDLGYLDFGARMYDPALGRWFTQDPLAEKYYSVSPYAYCANNPVKLIDPNGEDIYMFFAVKDPSNDKKAGEDNSMFWAAMMTLVYETLADPKFNSEKDIVTFNIVTDLGELGNQVEDIVDNYSSQYGQTKVFSLWSHSALDGPLGGIATSGNHALDEKQLTIEGWSKIEFNWSNDATAIFWGCRSGQSFANRLSSQENMRDVNVIGQMTYSYPSKFANGRVFDSKMAQGAFTYPVYMVGSKPIIGRFSNNSEPMIGYRNGVSTGRYTIGIHNMKKKR